MDEEVDELGQVLSVFDQKEEGHFSIDELSGDGVEVDLDGVFLLALAGGVNCLGRWSITL